MKREIAWEEPFDDSYGSGFITRMFVVSGRVYAVGFEEIYNDQQLVNKGIHINADIPDFQFPDAGMWAVAFDQVETAEAWGGYNHVRLPGLLTGKVLLKVARSIIEHYYVSNAGAYVFSAALDREHERDVDLVSIYNGFLGLGYKRTKPLVALPNMKCYGNLGEGGRGYVVTTESY